MTSHGTPLADRFIVGLTEAGEMMGVTSARVNQLRRRPDFPEPLEELACGPIWLKAAIEEYDAARRQRA